MMNLSGTRETNNGMAESSSSPLGVPRRGPVLSVGFIAWVQLVSDGGDSRKI